MVNSRFNLFTKKLLWIVLFIVFIFTSCSHAEDVFEEKDETESDSNLKEELIEYKNGVVLLNELSIDSVQIVNDENIKVYTKENLESSQYIGKIIVYSNDFSSKDLFIGKVKDMKETADYVSFETEIPLMDEVFEQLYLQPELNSENATIEFTPDPSDNVTYSGIVSNDVWNYIQPVNIDTVGTSGRMNGISSRAFVTPIDLTLKFESDDKNIFNGNIYYRIKGDIKINKDYSYEMSAHQIIGLEGSLEMASISKERKYIPFLKIKNGVTLYNNKLVGIRVKPSVNFFYSGGISLEAAFKYELMNVDSYFAFEKGNFINKALENKRDWFFRVKSIKSEASFGFSLNSDFYAFIFSENFFSGGVGAVAGIEMAGEKNVGIQFPDIANFDFQVGVTPFLELTPFAVVRMPELKRLEGLTMNISSESFTADLIPNIHDMNYEKANKKLHYNANVGSFENSFIDAPECGVAIFEKGKETPIEHGALKQNSRKTRGSDLSFNISNDVAYEIAPYVKTYSDGYVYGEKMDVPLDVRDLLIKLYNDTNGDNWIRNDNWCSEKPIDEWYGVEYDNTINKLSVKLIDNNLTNCTELDLQGFNLYGELFIKDKNLESVKIKNNNNNYFYTEIDAKNVEYNNSIVHSFHRINYEYLQDLNLNKCNAENIDFEPLKTSLTTLNIVDTYIKVCFLMGFPNLEYININGATIVDLRINNNYKLKTLNINNSKITYHFDVYSNSVLENIIFQNTEFDNAELSDNSQLVYLGLNNVYAISYIRISRSSNLRSIDFGEIGLIKNSHIDIIDCPILQQIPSFLEEIFLKHSYHDARYYYWDEPIYDSEGNHIGNRRCHRDNGVGWWFAGEPARGYHLK